MNLYLLSQTVNDGYDTYDRAVVCAETEEEARKIHPDGITILPIPENSHWLDRDWVKSPDQVKVKLIGTSSDGIKAGEVICASFNAG